MFTGIVEEKGELQRLELRGSSGRILLRCRKVLEGTRVGDSIAVNGICLTVTGLREDGFWADVMAETVRRTGLRGTVPGTVVNLERAMPANGRFGGHIVSGHVDGVGVIRSIVREENAVWFHIAAPAGILRYMVEKGSVAVDGISLTVARVSGDSFSVSVIPHTMQETSLFYKREGDRVNLENDSVARYAERLLRELLPLKQGAVPGGLTWEYLRGQGF